jgi:hypothetical protein
MKLRFYEIFRNKVLLEVEITKVENESNLEKIIKKSPKVTNTLIKPFLNINLKSGAKV